MRLSGKSPNDEVRHSLRRDDGDLNQKGLRVGEQSGLERLEALQDCVNVVSSCQAIVPFSETFYDHCCTSI